VDREFAFTVLVLVGVGSMLMVSALPGGGTPPEMPADQLERRCWRRIWLPLLPATLILASLCGWLAMEPDPTARIPRAILVAALPFSGIWIRALRRAVGGLLAGPGGASAVAVGVVRPRVLVSPAFSRAIDQQALDAACAHEEAHARHRDPLRLWLARIATDLQWPLPPAARRYARWRFALELARDQEARRQGAEGADLATAVLAAVRLQIDAADPTAALHDVSDAADLRNRIARLLEPIEAPPVPGGVLLHNAVLSTLIMVWTLAAWLGADFGDRALRILFRGI
jgi:hypothetical protein